MPSGETTAFRASLAGWGERGCARDLALVFALALAARAALALLAAAVDAGLTGDEILYHARAGAALRLVGDALTGTAFARSDLDAFYQRGIWPPLHALWLAPFLLLPLDSVLAARLGVAVASAASSALAFAVARALAGRRAGAAAAVIHAAHPLLLYYGVSLWSESLYAAFALGLWWAGLRWLRGVGVRSALLIGAALGGMGLTRAAVVPFLVCIPLFMVAARRTRTSAVHALLAFAVAMACMAPWNAQLSQREGRLTLFSSLTSVQLWAGNNPYEGDLLDYGATVASFREGADRALQVAQVEAVRAGEDVEASARRLAFAHIRAQPGRFVQRCIERALLLLSHDSFMLRFFTTATAPALPLGPVLGLWLASLLGFAAIASLAALGFLAREVSLDERLVGLLAVVCVLGAPMLTVSHTRLAFPALVLIVPMAGVGFERLRFGRPRGVERAVAWGVGVGLLALGLALLPVHLRVSAQTSAFYAHALEPLAARMPAPSVYVDFFELRGRAGRRVELSGASPGLRFPRGAEAPRASLVLTGVRAIDRVPVHSDGPGVPRLRGELRERDGTPRSFEVDPIERESWNRWIPLAVGLELRWRGGELPGQ